MSLASGTRLGSYEVTGRLGEGGMGVVYRARDVKLGRDVALKVLPESLARDPDRLARFKREAHVLASLNHPHIGAIYGFEDADGVNALVLELVDGPGLEQRIASGPIPLDEALAIARQIAEALGAAHEQGIIHRDLKPANIKLRPDGTVKILDFGLAKAFASDGATSSGALTNSPTLTSPIGLTGVGMLLGTAAYMSPEQAKGRPVDKRADVWAFGAVLYEMLTGRTAFRGGDVSETLVSVIRDEPAWSALPLDTPPGTRQALRLCLQKDPKRRVGDISAIRLAIDGALDADAGSGSMTGTVSLPRAPIWRRVVGWALAPLLASLATGFAVYRLRPESPPARASRFVIATPPDAPVPGLVHPDVAISRDGSRVAYRGRLPGSTTVLYTQDIGTLDARLLPGTEGAASPFFSPDGEWIAYVDTTGRTLKRVSVRGGPSTIVCTLDTVLFGGSWGADDHIVLAKSSGLQRVPAVGGDPQPITSVDAEKGATSHRWPDVLPNGAGILFTLWNGSAERSQIAVVPLSAGATTATSQVREILVGGTNPRFSPTGHIVYAVGGTLRAVGFDVGRLAVHGSPVPVLEGIGVVPTGAAQFALASDGSLLFARGMRTSPGRRTLMWVDRQGRQEAVNVPPRAYTYARLSPDGTRIALDVRDQQNDIWIWHLTRGTLERLTFDPGFNRMPVWSRDGTRIAFTSDREGPEGVYWQAADGSGAAERLSPRGSVGGPTSFSPDDAKLVFFTPIDGPADLGVIAIKGERRTDMLLDGSFREINGEVSSDGGWLAYESNESGQAEIYVRSFPDTRTSRRQISTSGGTRPLWSRDGRELFYYVAPDTLMAVPVKTGKKLEFGRPTVAVKGDFAAALNAGRHYDVSLDGKRFLLLKDVEHGDARETHPQLVVVQHWSEELKRLMATK